MEDKIKPSALAEAAGISMSYSSEIIAGKRRPSQALAIRIFQKTGRKFAPIEHLADKDIRAIARIHGLAA